MTPSILSTWVWIVFTMMLAAPSAFYFRTAHCPTPPIGFLCYDVSLIPTILTGIAGLAFALIIFIVEYMRARQLDQVSRSGLRKSLIFPLGVSTLTSFCILLAWHRSHNVLFGLMPLVIGLMAIVAVLRLFRQFWEEEKFDFKSMPVIEALDILFFTDVLYTDTNGRAWSLKLPFWSRKSLTAVAENELQSFLRSVLREDRVFAGDSERYVVELGKYLGRLEKRLEEYSFLKNKQTSVPYLVAWYARQLVIFAPADMDWLDERHIGYLPVLNAELAFTSRSRPQFKDSLAVVTGLYWKKEVRNEIAKKIWKWINGDITERVERKLFERDKSIQAYEALIPFVEAIFKAYEDLLRMAYKERDELNFKKIASAYSRCFHEFIQGGFGADRDVEQEGDNARFFLERSADGLSEEKIQQYKASIALDDLRKRVEHSKHEMILVLATKFLEDVIREQDPTEHEHLKRFLDTLCAYLPTDIPNLLQIALGLSENAEEKWDWVTLNMPERSDDYEGGVTTWTTGSVGSAGSSIILYCILTRVRSIPANLVEQVVLSPHSHYRVEGWVELLTKLQSTEPLAWARMLTEEQRKGIETLLSQMKLLQKKAKEEELREIREKPVVSHAKTKFRDAILRGYQEKGSLRKILTSLKMKEKHSENKKYQGNAPAYGLYETQLKEYFFHDQSVSHMGESIGGMMGRTEDKIIADAIVKDLQISGSSIKSLLDFLSTLSGQRGISIILDRSVINKKLSKSSAFNELWTPGWKVPKKEIPENANRPFDGFLRVGSRKFPVHSMSLPESLRGSILIAKKGHIGTFEYFSPRRDKKPLRDNVTTPLLIRSAVYSEENDYLAEKLKMPKFLSDTNLEDRKSKALELVEVEIGLRAVFFPEPNGIWLFRLSEVEKTNKGLKHDIDK